MFLFITDTVKKIVNANIFCITGWLFLARTLMMHTLGVECCTQSAGQQIQGEYGWNSWKK